jgi:membrane-bound lytic murein transglycosylase B
VIKADRSQSVFQKPFLEFSQALISRNRLQMGAAKSQEFDRVFQRAQREYGVPRGILLAFWAFETDFGQVQGDFNTVNALVTLGHDCRRPELFQPQILAALTLFERGMIDPATTTGAWAGEIGMVQMLPGDILADGVDGDGDGKRSRSKPRPPTRCCRRRASLRHWAGRRTSPGCRRFRCPTASTGR